MNVEEKLARDAVADMADSTGLPVKRDVPGTRLTTLSVGGPVRRLIEINSLAEATSVMSALMTLGHRYRVLGFGSNLLIPDSGVDDWVLKLGRGLRSVSALGNGRFFVGGAMPLMTLARDLSDQGFSGLEFAGGIPASVGGAVWMNAGAHGGEMSDLVEEVQFIDPSGVVATAFASDLEFEYRSSNLPAGAIVISCVLKLIPGDVERSRQRRQEFLRERKKRQPLHLPSSGSVFKNPSRERSAGWYLEQAGQKGRRIGGAQISELHANWIVNPTRTATSAEVSSLLRACQDSVREGFAIDLEPELVRW